MGRERELKQLDQFLKKVLTGQGQIAFVIGGAGRGKTALLIEFARQAQTVHPDLLMAAGHCDLYAGLGDSYLPFQDIMAMLTGDVAARLADDTLTYVGGDLVRRTHDESGQA